MKRMKLQEIQHEALALSEQDRAALVLSLIDTLATPGAEATDAEVARRDEELESGAVTPMTHEEFMRRVQEGRGR